MISSEYNVFLSFILIGFVIGFIFDFFRIFRRVYNTSNFITIIEDVLFWLISGFILLLGIFVINHGKIRAYLFLGLFIGISIYLITISKIIIAIGINLLTTFNKIVIIPLIRMYKFGISIIFKMTNLAKYNIKKFKNRHFSKVIKEKRRKKDIFVE